MNTKFRELFCLFCFCNTTLALDRIDVIVLKEEGVFGIEDVEKELLHFDLDHAHWYKTIYYYNYSNHYNLIYYYVLFQL